jgi:hypothetical protein
MKRGRPIGSADAASCCVLAQVTGAELATNGFVRLVSVRDANRTPIELDRISASTAILQLLHLKCSFLMLRAG